MKPDKEFIARLPDIKMSDQLIFKKYSDKAELWGHFFLSLLLNKVKWLEMNETLCIFQKDFFDKTWQLQSLPLGEEHNVIKVLNYLISNKLTSKILFTTDKDLALMTGAVVKFKKSVKISEEFIYRTKDIIGLAGNKYKKIRQHISWFKKSYPHQIDFITEKDFEEIKTFLASWQKERANNQTDETSPSFDEDYKNSVNALECFMKVAGAKGLVLRSNNKIIGLKIVGVINENFVVHFIMKTFHKEYKGATEFLLQEAAKCFSETTYFNTGGYGKSKSLRVYKMGLQPEKVNSIYKIYL